MDYVVQWKQRAGWKDHASIRHAPDALHEAMTLGYVYRKVRVVKKSPKRVMEVMWEVLDGKVY